MKNYTKSIAFAVGLTLTAAPFVHADVVTSDSILAERGVAYNKQQILAMVSDTEVQNKLASLGVSQADAIARINNMTPDEVNALNQQLNDAPAGAGLIGVVVTVLVVVAVLDLLGVTDAYPFIRPVGE
ncbi:PA2779 family protein [Aliiglaciecola sp. LCG003]|uniref:PA2779 family protein n=1 Tax=Aliiglaciecola sp. LCG003 TaxID=3053655 RepID=UPI00257284C5|nr:PA2779 family protein [Aliiglaciecola sp. LCG003]WJG09058.1 PA2779 family protein [Aliiglaciecola sp. LCG003]